MVYDAIVVAIVPPAGKLGPRGLDSEKREPTPRDGSRSR